MTSFGDSVAISGTTVVVGADGHAKSAGRAYVFTKTAGGWKQARRAEGLRHRRRRRVRISVAISGTTAVVGARPRQACRPGVCVPKTAAGWKQTAELKGSDTVADDGFGVSVAISGTPAVSAGAPRIRGHTCSRRRQRLDAGRRAEGSRHRRQRRLRLLGGHLGHDRRRRCTRPSKAPVGHTCSPGRDGWKQAAELKGSDTVAGD